MHQSEDETALRRAVHDNPHMQTPRLVLADYLDENGSHEEAAMHRVIARPGDEEALHAYAGHTGGDSGEAFVHTEKANASENRARPHNENHFFARDSAERAVNHTTSARKVISHDNAADTHRWLADNSHYRAEHEEATYNHRAARVFREAAEAHLHAAALHEAAAYHHRNKS